MSSLSTHVLDTSTGRPAAALEVVFERRDGEGRWLQAGRGVTNSDGRVKDLATGPIAAGVYRLRFHTGEYHRANGIQGFYPYVEVVFEMTDAGGHYHVPLLLSPWGFSTYRGS